MNNYLKITCALPLLAASLLTACACGHDVKTSASATSAKTIVAAVPVAVAAQKQPEMEYDP
jgi:hypothetical protein